MSNWKKSFTLILVPHNNTQSKSVSIRGISLLILGGLGGMIASLLLFLAVLGLLTNPYRVYSQYNSYEEQIAELQSENEEYKQWKMISQSLQEELEETRSRQQAVVELTGLDRALDIDFTGSKPEEGAFEELERAQELLAESSRTNQKMDKMEEFLANRTEVLSRTPMLWPTEGWISSGYGYRQDPMGGQGRSYHQGVDIASWHGTPVRATAAGEVKFTGRNGGYGKTVEIEHEFGFSTLYAHLNDYEVEAGETINQGDVVGTVGSTGRATGSHLHYEVRVNGETVDPDPYLVEEFDLYNKFAPREAAIHARN